jgi:hypothetical protein
LRHADPNFLDPNIGCRSQLAVPTCRERANPNFSADPNIDAGCDALISSDMTLERDTNNVLTSPRAEVPSSASALPAVPPLRRRRTGGPASALGDRPPLRPGTEEPLSWTSDEGRAAPPSEPAWFLDGPAQLAACPAGPPASLVACPAGALALLVASPAGGCSIGGCAATALSLATWSSACFARLGWIRLHLRSIQPDRVCLSM